MGRLNRGPNGPVSGKFGSVIGSSWKGIYYIKGLQKKSTKPRSPLQIAYQARFGLAARFLQPFKKTVDLGFSKINPEGATGYNMAISHLLNFSVKGFYPDFQIDYPSVVLTLGQLLLPKNVNMELNGRTLKLSWSTETEPYFSSAKDTLQILSYLPRLNECYTTDGSFIREMGELEQIVGYELQAGDTIHVYIYMVQENQKRWSNSMYVGALEVP